MTKRFKIELPKIPLDLETANLQDIYHDEDPYLSNCIITNQRVDYEEIDHLKSFLKM
ncbi:hypothetical protein [Alkalihalobacillus deserti]|uniref:hypothetical protein n=1 Tax=Alkalihalobacillus deserti TaxID=2879466 RepID=UPI001D1355E6|nr:hypothetical protein [Alkalihalobacillus deserti]